MADALALGFSVLSMAFEWLFDNELTSMIIGVSLIMFVFGIVMVKVRG